MVEPSRTSDLPGPRRPEESKESREVDPEKFKKVLKVEETDESGKRGKRKLKRGEEEGEEDVSSHKETSSTKKDFAGLLEEGKTMDDSPFAVKTPQHSGKASPQTHAELVEGEKLPSVQQRGEATFIHVGEEESPKEGLQAQPSGPVNTSQAPTAQAPKESEDSSEKTCEGRQKNKPPETAKSTDGKSTEKKSDTTSKEVQAPSTQKKNSGKVEKKAEKTELQAKPVSGQKKTSQADQQIASSKKESPKEVRSEVTAEQITESSKTKKPEKKEKSTEAKKAQESGASAGIEGAALPEKQQTEGGKDEDKRQKKEEEGIQAPEQPAVSGPTQTTLSSATEIPALSQMPPDVQDFLERTLGIMTIEQHKGVTTTTITLNMPQSILNGSQVVLDHYSTAPNSFNLQLLGSPQAVEYFNQNIDDLIAAFQQSKLSFKVNVQTPALLREYRVVEPTDEQEGEEQGT